MKILLITTVTIFVVACYGNPVGYSTEFEAQRLANLQMTQKLANEALKPLSTQERYRNRHASSQSSRNEYRIFGNDASSLNSERDVSALSKNYETDEGAIHQIRNPEFEDASSLSKNQVNNFPSTSGTPIQRSSFYQQDLNSDMSYAHNPVPEVQAVSNLEISRPVAVENRTPTAKLNSQEVLQKGTALSLDHRTEIQTGVYNSRNVRNPSVEDRTFTTTLHSQEVGQKSTPFVVGHPSEFEINRDSFVDQLSQNRERTLNQNGKNTFGSRSDAIEDHISESQRAVFQKQGTFNASDASFEDQNRRILSSQNGMSQLYDINQNRKYLTEISHVSQHGQSKFSEEPEQYQHFSQRGQITSSQEPENQYQYFSQQEQIKLPQEPVQYHLSQEGQIKSSQEPRNQYQRFAQQGEIKSSQEPTNQYGHFSRQEQIKSSQDQTNQYQQNQRTSVPVSTLTKDSFDQIRNGFESRRISGNRQPENQSKYALTFVQYPSNQQKDNLRGNEDVHIASDFKDHSNKRDEIWNRKHDVQTRTEDVAQGLFQTLSGQKTIFNTPQFRQGQVKSDLASGSKGGPVVLHKTGTVASSHAVIIGRDSGIPGKGASLTQHLKTPYAHYTYSHSL